MNNNAKNPHEEIKVYPKKLIAQSLRDIEFICKQIIRFKKMQMSELRAHLKKDQLSSFCTIPNLGGSGDILCGPLAWEKFDRLAERIVESEPELGRRINLGQIKKFVINAFARRYLSEHLDISLESAELIHRDVIEQSRLSLEDKEHYLPCILFPKGGPDEFSIGPITFTRTTQFLLTKKQILRNSVKKEIQAHIKFVDASVDKGFPRDRAITPEGSEKIIRQLHAHAIKTYRGYPWIAQVKIINCNKDVSDELATKAVETSLNVIRVLLGADHTKKIRLAWSRGDVLKTANMWASADDVIRVSLGSSAIGPVGFENWYEGLTQGAYYEVMGSALAGLINPVTTYHLQDRFIDAINWFGDAATDLQPTSSLVKYISAIERLLFGKFERDRRKKFASRVKLICDIFGCDVTKGNPYDNATEIYKTRSALLHGEFSPRDNNLRHLTWSAEELSRFCILCATQLYPMLLRAYKDPSPEDLEEAFIKIEMEGLNWLLQDSGYSLSK